MNDSQIMTLAISIVIPISLLIYSNSRVTDTRNSINSRIDDLRTSLNGKIDKVDSSLNARIDKLEKSFDSRVADLKEIVRAEIKVSESNVLNQITTQFNELKELIKAHETEMHRK